MGKKGKYYAINQQEDEDVYYINPAKANFDGNSKSKQHITSPDNSGKTEPRSLNKEIRSIILSHPMVLN